MSKSASLEEPEFVRGCEASEVTNTALEPSRQVEAVVLEEKTFFPPADKQSPPGSLLHETRIHGTLTFPCTMYFAQGGGEDLPFDLKPHWHDSIEIIHLIEGEYFCRFNASSLYLQGETFCFLEGGSIHSMRSQGAYQEEAFLFHPTLLSSAFVDESTQGILDPLRQGKLKLPLTLTKEQQGFGELQKGFERLRALFLTGIPHGDQRLVKKPPTQLRIKAELFTLLASLWEAGHLSHEDGKPDLRLEELKQVLRFIRDNYTGKIYLRELAQIMNMNEQYFSRFFKKVMGKAPIAYINEMRIREGTLLLSQGDMSVSAIATACGFSNQGHFLNEFKKINGCTPLEYRKRREGEPL